MWRFVRSSAKSNGRVQMLEVDAVKRMTACDEIEDCSVRRVIDEVGMRRNLPQEVVVGANEFLHVPGHLGLRSEGSV
jgi:hypothetical protein